MLCAARHGYVAPVTLPELSRALDYLRQNLAAGGVPPDVITAFSLACDELFSNLINYSGSTKFCLSVRVAPEHAEMRLANNDTPYNPLLNEPPRLDIPADKRKPGGLGLFLVKQLTDSQRYRRQAGWNVLILRKKYVKTNPAR